MAHYLLVLLTSVGWVLHCAQGATTIHTLEVDSLRGKPTLILLTGFGPFGSISDNPSGRIAAPLAREIAHRCPDVAPSVDAKKLVVEPGVISSLMLENYRKVISIGVDAGAVSIRLETAARNHYYDPYTGKDSLIDPTLPLDEVLYGVPWPVSLPSTLWGFEVVKGDETSAGTYVCNDTYFRLIQRAQKGYFAHIPNIEPKADLRLTKALSEIFCETLAN